MELTVNTVASSATNDLFGNRQRFNTFLRIEKRLNLCRSPKQRLPFLETKAGLPIWFGQSAKKIMQTMSDTDFALYLKDNSHEFSLGLLQKDRAGTRIPFDDQKWVLFLNGKMDADVTATIEWDATEDAEKVDEVTA